jgi:hypothetical protein
MWCKGGLAVSEHYEQFEIPEAETELRPYLFHRYTTGATRMGEARRIFSHLLLRTGPEE